uniref:Uncharacterized protein n=1 Tax=Rhizophora mucronata TaxID=61149 RepID=A0A2P2QXC5_RHIMU
MRLRVSNGDIGNSDLVCIIKQVNAKTIAKLDANESLLKITQ